jgi:hypothetical protein
MSNYFLLGGKNSRNVASAIVPEPEGSKLPFELIPTLIDVEELPFELSLVKLTVGRHGLVKSNVLSDLKEIWLDYQPNNQVWPLMSEKLKSVIESHLTGNEGIQWIKASVKTEGAHRVYYIPRFEKMLDVLDLQKTTFVPGTDMVLRPCFSRLKVRNYSFFHKPSTNNYSWRIPPGLYVDEALKKAIQKEKLTGISFEKTFVA